jgi:hypothetical protein
VHQAGATGIQEEEEEEDVTCLGPSTLQYYRKYTILTLSVSKEYPSLDQFFLRITS